jgi:transcriptional regulator with XRE-family HTH domain
MTRSATSTTVATAMATARRLAGLGTREFASAICDVLGRSSLHPSTVSKWEHGVVIPPADVLVSAALIADVPIQVLFDGALDGSEHTDRLLRLEEQMSVLSGRVARLWAVSRLPGA